MQSQTMTKIYLTLAAALLCLQVTMTAQTITNSDFENWTPSGKEPPFDWSEPTGWTSSNSMTEWTSAGVRKVTSAYHGSAAVAIASVMISEGWYSMICNGTPEKVFDFSAPRLNIITGGEPISIKPSKLTGYYKFTSQTAGDSAYAIIILKKWNSLAGHTDTIGWGAKTLGPAANYTKFEVMVNYEFTTQPDSVVIAFYSTDPAKPAKPAQFTQRGELTIDFISLDDAAGVKPEQTAVSYSISPNPAQDKVTIKSKNQEEINAVLYTSDGKSLGNYRGIGSLTIISSAAVKPGIYFLKITTGQSTSVQKIIFCQE
jgi:hypothetical protein